MKVTKRQLRRIIKEQMSQTPSSRIEVDWDFYMGGGDPWDNMSYKDQLADSGIPPIIDIPADVMAEYQSNAEEYGASQAEQLITDWLSEEFGWLHDGWSWV
tara:strand:+ start:732 stop:1034 length:303 start_codon:yes stop_codon:yes gene_type:complete